MNYRTSKLKSANDKNNQEINAIIESVRYLKDEAGRVGFQQINVILRKALIEIEKWFNTKLKSSADLADD